MTGCSGAAGAMLPTILVPYMRLISAGAPFRHACTGAAQTGNIPLDVLLGRRLTTRYCRALNTPSGFDPAASM